MITVYLGDVSEYLAIAAHSDDPNAKLITDSNCNDLIAGTYYTSIADIGGLNNLSTVLTLADQVIYAPPPNNRWSNSKMQQWSEDYLEVFSLRTKVKNFSISEPDNKSNMLALVDSRKTTDPQLWIAGCSISHGVGVDSDQKYGQLLADKLNLSASFLTYPASSVSWSADQILRSDLHASDTVVWGLTSSPRVSYWNNDLTHITPASYTTNPKLNREFSFDYFTSEDLVYREVLAVHQVINFCEKVGARLLLVSLLNDSLIKYIKDLPNFLMLYKLWGRDKDTIYIDVGSDQEHPGPETHSFYANEIYNFLNQLTGKF